MDEMNICMLAKLLRETGDEVLQGDKTLLLCDTLLESLKDSFKCLAEEIDSDTSFIVTKTNNSPEAIFRDIQFLHDCIQKVVHLSITKDTSKPPRNVKRVDISKFRSLKTLEVSKIPIQCVGGILQVRGHLQRISCSHSILQLKDLLINCGADRSIAQIWEELNEVVLSHNALGGIDNSFYYAPLLHTIDLSHNKLKTFGVENCLPHLKYLNLSFNLLNSIPVLGKEGAGKLKVLLLKNNCLENLTGLSKLKNIVELDLSCNSLFHHNALTSLAALPLLSWINLVGNPLSFCSNHRANTVEYLHLNTIRNMITLDGLALSWREKKRVRNRAEQRLRAASAVGTVSAAEAATEDVERSDLLRSIDSAVSTDSVQGSDDSYAQGGDDFNSPVVHVTKSKKSLRSKRLRQSVKEAVITESLKEQEETAAYEEKGSDQHHLQVKQHVEQLRERFGEDNWLSERGATHLQAVLGLPRVSPPAYLNVLSQHLQPETQLPADAGKHPSSSEEPKTENVPSDIDIKELEDPVEREILDSSEDWEEDVEPWISQNEEEDVDDRKLFTVRKEKSSDLLLLAVGLHSLQERDVITGRVLQKWDLATLQSCELLSEDESAVRLTFKVLRRDRRCRVYNVDSSEAKMLLQILQDILSLRSLSEMNQVAYRCMKCSTQFSQEEDVQFASRGKTVLCPNCSSNIVCVMEEVPLPTARAVPTLPPEPTISVNVSQLSTPPVPSLTSSQSSIGSKDSCFPPAAAESARACCLQVAAIVHQADAPSVSPSRPSPPPVSAPRSAASLDDSINSNARRCDSDIEVISNPSQSSIEVIDGESRTPGRKRSSEERQPALVSSELNFKTVSNPAIPSLGLTESSSSGSFTDSICTTYETQRSAVNGSVNGELSPTEQRHKQRQQNGVSNQLNRKNAEKSVEEEVLYDTGPIPSVQEMFEGLLEKVDKKLATSADLKPISNEVDNTLNYSYSDFQHVDHRLRLFFLQELLDSHEELLMVLRADALKFDFDNPFPSLLVFSSARFWLLEVTGIEGDNPESWLQERLRLPISCVNAVFPLPWAQGVGVSCREPHRYILMLLQDSQYTSNFIQAAESLLPETCGVVSEPANYHHQFFSETVCSNFGEPESKLHLVSLFNSFQIEGEDESSAESGVLIVRAADIYVIESNLTWLFPNTSDNSAIKIVAGQQISNLMEAVTDDCRVGLHFVDEARHKEETWNFVFQTAACVQTVVTAVSTPWEQLFSVPLQVTESNQGQH